MYACRLAVMEPERSSTSAIVIPHVAGRAWLSRTLMNRWFASCWLAVFVRCTETFAEPVVPTVAVPTYGWVWLPVPLELPPKTNWEMVLQPAGALFSRTS